MTEGLPLLQRRWAMLSIIMAVCLSVLDSTIVNVALPTIAQDLQASAKASIWVINAYQLTLSICLLPLSSLGNKVGYRKIYCLGLVIFSVASLACSLSTSLIMLTLSRVLQGIGAAGVLSMNAAIVYLIYTKKDLGRGLGLIAFSVAVSAALGPTIASLVLSLGPWQWLFALNVPFGLAALWMASHHIPDSAIRTAFDGANSLLYAVTIAILIISIDGMGYELNLLSMLAGLLCAGGLGYILVRRELKVSSPLFPVDLFRIPIFSASIAASICSFIGQMAAYTSLPFFIQTVLNRSAIETGLLITPWPIAAALTAPLAGLLSDRFPVGILGAIGLTLFSAGLFLLSALTAEATSFEIMWRMAICGGGFGIFQAPNNRAILSSAPLHRSSAAGGMQSTARLIGQTMGATMVSFTFSLMLPHPTQTVLYAAGLLSLMAAGVSMIRLSPKISSSVQIPR